MQSAVSDYLLPFCLLTLTLGSNHAFYLLAHHCSLPLFFRPAHCAVPPLEEFSPSVTLGLLEAR